MPRSLRIVELLHVNLQLNMYGSRRYPWECSVSYIAARICGMQICVPCE
jgi:hypothetical protein